MPVRRLADHHRALELRLVAPDGCPGLRNADVAPREADVVRDGVRPRAALPDLAAEARLRPVAGAEEAARAVRLEHGEGGVALRLEARLRLRTAGARVVLEPRVRERAPAPALADQLDLGWAFARHQRLDAVVDGDDARAGRLAERRPPIAEDAGVAVLIGGDRRLEPEVGRDAREGPHRVHAARVLRVRLDAREVAFGACPLDLELRHEDRVVAVAVLQVDDRPLVREKPEPGEVVDVVGPEDDVPGGTDRERVLEQPPAPAGELVRGDHAASLSPASMMCLLGAHSSAGERSLHTREVPGSIPGAPTYSPCIRRFSPASGPPWDHFQLLLLAGKGRREIAPQLLLQPILETGATSARGQRTVAA